MSLSERGKQALGRMHDRTHALRAEIAGVQPRIHEADVLIDALHRYDKGLLGLRVALAGRDRPRAGGPHRPRRPPHAARQRDGRAGVAGAAAVTHWFDRLAVSAAEGPRMTRRAGLERAAVVILAAGPLAALAERATAAPSGGRPPPPTRAMRAMPASGTASARHRWRASRAGSSPGRKRHPRRRPPSRRAPLILFAQSACYSVAVAASVSDKVACQAGGACQDGNPPGSPTPPQLQPPGTDLCAPCLQVGGKCCYGSDPTAPCACIPPNRECKDFCS